MESTSKNKAHSEKIMSAEEEGSRVNTGMMMNSDPSKLQTTDPESASEWWKINVGHAGGIDSSDGIEGVPSTIEHHQECSKVVDGGEDSCDISMNLTEKDIRFETENLEIMDDIGGMDVGIKEMDVGIKEMDDFIVVESFDSQEAPSTSSDFIEKMIIDEVDDSDSKSQEDKDAIDDSSDEWDSDIEAMLEKIYPKNTKKNKGKKRKIEELGDDKEDQEEEEKCEEDKDAKKESEAAANDKDDTPDVEIIKSKKVLKRRGRKTLEGLPSDWIEVPHVTGMPVYLHRPTRVCTWSMPYNLGTGSLRRHRPPIAGIPCLQYKKALLEAQEQAAKSGESPQIVTLGSEVSSQTSDAPIAIQPAFSSSSNTLPHPPSNISITPGAPPQPASDVSSTSAAPGDRDPSQQQGTTTSLAPVPIPKWSASNQGVPISEHINKVTLRSEEVAEHTDLSDYFDALFEFQIIHIKKYKSWKIRRQEIKEQKLRMSNTSADRPQFPLVPTFQCPVTNNQDDNRVKEVVLDMKEKSPVSVLLEYTQRVMKAKPNYTITETNNVNNPYEAVVQINNYKYGRGAALSKRVAKIQAAIATLEILAPELWAKVQNDNKKPIGLDFFNSIPIDDERVPELCFKTGELSPFMVLQEYRTRKYGMKDAKYAFDVQITNRLRGQKIKYTMTLGEHTVSGFAKSGKEAKNMGGQKLIKLLHPNIKTWGGIIKMYGRGRSEENKVKKEASRNFMLMASKSNEEGHPGRPNLIVLGRLKEQMRKIYDMQEASSSS